MRFGNSGGEVTIPFICDEINCAQVGDGEITARNPDLRIQELLAQDGTGEPGQLLRRLIAGVSELLCEDAPDLLPVFM